MQKSRKIDKTEARSEGWYEPSSGNVYRDLGHDEEKATHLLLRGSLMIEIANIVEERGWSQADAAQVLGVSQPRISELMTGRIGRFSVDLLLKYLLRLGKNVSFVLEDKPEVA